MTFHMPKTSVLTALMTVLSVCAHAADSPKPFVLEGYERANAPLLITAGKYEQIIARGARRAARGGTAATETHTNLCVAFIKTNRLGEARGACNDAIEAALGNQAPVPVPGPYRSRERWRDVARGYSNRAVLNWLSGERTAAESDLAMAAGYAPQAHFVLTNAAALRLRGSSGAAIAALDGR